MSILNSNIPAIKTVIEDPKLKKDVVYHRFKSESFDAVLGYNVEVYDELEITGCKFKATAKTGAVRESLIQIGEPVFLFRPADLGEPLSVKDQIVDEEGAVFKVKSVVPLHGIATEILVESGGIQEE